MSASRKAKKACGLLDFEQPPVAAQNAELQRKAAPVVIAAALPHLALVRVRQGPMPRQLFLPRILGQQQTADSRGGGVTAAGTHSRPSSTEAARPCADGRVYTAVVSRDSWPSSAASSTSLPGCRQRNRRANECRREWADTGIRVILAQRAKSETVACMVRKERGCPPRSLRNRYSSPRRSRPVKYSFKARRAPAFRGTSRCFRPWPSRTRTTPERSRLSRSPTRSAAASPTRKPVSSSNSTRA